MADETGSESMSLGGNIVLSGFRDVDRATMIVVKKMVGSYARKFSDYSGDLKELALHVKKIHATEGSGMFELRGKANAKGRVFNSKVEHRNLFFAMDKALSKLQTEIMK